MQEALAYVGVAFKSFYKIEPQAVIPMIMLGNFLILAIPQ
jgi:hypothetical protein